MGGQSQVEAPSLAEELEPDNVEKRGDPVLPADFLPLLIEPSRIGDGNFKDAAFHFGQLYRDLGLKPESLRLETDFLEDFLFKDFITGLHIRQVQVGKHIGEGG
jgi:hypothetical protein